MRLFRSFLVLTILSVLAVFSGSATAQDAAAPAPNTLTTQEVADGWVLLFDGESLFGWKAANDADWKVEDGAITATEGTPGLIHTTGQYGNYELKVDFKSVEGGNSGIFLRTSPKPADLNGRCYEINVADWGTNDWPTGSIVHHKKVETANDSTDWQTLEATADGPNFTVKIDGVKVLELTDEKPLGRGFIGLQFRTGKIQFRNIKLKPIGGKKLFDGKSLDDWTVAPLGVSKATVIPEQGEIHLINGRDYLEAPGEYDDFMFQIDVFVDGDALNSGVFFRSIPDQAMNGYECQIQNGMVDGDPTKPQDCGTGGFFRRQNARRIVAKDREWFKLTLLADDKHMAAWVNGYPVSDWTDTRAAHENPRAGLRLEAGKIQIQGHDPTTDLRFKNIEISEIPDR